MRNIIRNSAIVFGLATTLSITSMAFASQYDPNQDLGATGDPAAYNRVITITPDTKWVNVSQNEDVKFVDSTTGKSFVWDFNTANPVFSLNSVAPAGTLDQQVTAYVDIPNSDD